MDAVTAVFAAVWFTSSCCSSGSGTERPLSLVLPGTGGASWRSERYGARRRSLHNPPEPASVLREGDLEGTTAAALAVSVRGVRKASSGAASGRPKRAAGNWAVCWGELMVALDLSLCRCRCRFFCTLFPLCFLMQATRVSFAEQFGDFVVKLTNWAGGAAAPCVIPGIARRGLAQPGCGACPATPAVSTAGRPRGPLAGGRWRRGWR